MSSGERTGDLVYDPNLSAKGTEQAQAMADELAPRLKEVEGTVMILSSPMRRAH